MKINRLQQLHPFLHLIQTSISVPECPLFSSPLLSLNVLQLRALISDFSIIISILAFCGLDCLLELDTPKLHVPTEIKVHSSLNATLIFPQVLYVTAWVHFFPKRCRFYTFLMSHLVLCEFINVMILSSVSCLHFLMYTPFFCALDLRLPSSLSHYTSLFTLPLSCVCVCVCWWTYS